MTSQRTILAAVAGACLLFAAAYAATWSAGASALRKIVATLADTSGPVSVETDRLRTKGFPFFLRGELRSAAIRIGEATWRTPALSVDALPINPSRFIFTAANPQTADLGRYGVYDVDILGGKAGLSRRNGAFLLDAEADSLTARPTRGEVGLAAKGVLLKAAPTDKTSRTFQASLFAGSIEIARAARTARADKVLADFIANVEGGETKADIRRLVFETGGASVEIKGAVSIGSDGYPAGALDATLKNPKGLAGFLADLGALSADEAHAASAALSLAAFATGGEIRAPIELKDGAARIAGVKIARLPKLR